MSGDTPTHWLDCPDCSCRVFARAEDLFGDGESEHCAACGSLVTISTDATEAESPLDVRVDEHGGAVVTRLRRAIFGAERDRDSAAEGLADVRVERDKALGEVERLTGELATLEFPGQYWKDEAFAHEQRADKLEVEVERLTEDETERVQDARHAMRLARVDRGVVEAEAARLRERVAVLEAKLDGPQWVIVKGRTTNSGRLLFTCTGCGAEDPAPTKSHNCELHMNLRNGPTLAGGTPAGATPSTPANIEIAWSALRVAASKHGSAPVRGVDVDLHEAVDMALTEARGATPSMTGPEFIAAARKSGLFTAEAVEEIRADIARQRGAPPSEPGGES